ncbi:TPA: hypothetical protein ACKRZL_001023 [Pseudomonas aeruginosa]|uniref:hypothetical protein n=1 Tax=Pseudomonas sp. NBRC 111135 TaxID=1661050 RepID=UPI000ACA7811|nr:hypothetical protein [Pseudomonas sp. NBRC 111135]HEP8341119.1 hypothetical protein [Pseudomonas aeruginosa]
MKHIKFIAISLALIPSFALADFCDILAGNSAPSCRSNARVEGATIFGNWLRIKPEKAQSSSGKKGYYVSGTTPAVSTLGVPHNGRLLLTLECFSGKRSMTIGALPYMMGLTNGSNKAFDLTFKVDNKSSFTESWPLNWQRAELQAPPGSNLANALQGAKELIVTTNGIVGNKSTVGYVYQVDGFDKMNSGICL